MNRLVPLGLVLTLALSGCHREPPSSSKDKTASAPKDGAPSKEPIEFKPQTGRLVSSDEVPLLEQINRESTKVITAVIPGIVRITATHQADPRVKLFGKNLPFQFHFGPNSTHANPDNDPAYGAGVILRKDGYIISNAHVVDGAKDIEVQLHDKRLFSAHVVATDSALDISVLKIEATNLVPLPWGDSDRVQVGEQIFAIGNPFNQEGSVSRGVISATARDLPGSPHDENFLQTDAAINPGNSGGALVNIHGEVIGISTLIASTSGGNEGVGFAIPSNLARHAVEGLLKESSPIHGFLGVRFPSNIDEGVNGALGLGSKRGVLLAWVEPGTPADHAGLHTGDFITEMDGHKVDGVIDLRLLVAQIPIGKEVAVSYIRDGATKSTTVKIAEAPNKLPSGNKAAGDSAAPKDAATGVNVLNGLQVSDLNDKTRQQFNVDSAITSGVVIGLVEYSSPADLKGVMRGDVIESINVDHGSTRPVATARDFADIANNLKPGQDVVILVRHGNTSSFIYLTPQK